MLSLVLIKKWQKYTKLYSEKNISSQTFAKISNLRSQGEEKLKLGEIDNAELIFDKALALFNK